MELDRRDFLLSAVVVGTVIGTGSNVSPASEGDIDQWGEAVWGAGTWGGVDACAPGSAGEGT